MFSRIMKSFFEFFLVVFGYVATLRNHEKKLLFNSDWECVHVEKGSFPCYWTFIEGMAWQIIFINRCCNEWALYLSQECSSVWGNDRSPHPY